MINRIICSIVIGLSLIKQLYLFMKLLESCVERNIEKYQLQEELEKTINQEPAYTVYFVKNRIIKKYESNVKQDVYITN
jgi:hypothetical protein